MTTQRAQRVGRQLLQEISTIVEKDLGDPRPRMATFTGVSMSPDLRHACIRFSCLGDESERLLCSEGLRNARGYLRREVSRRLGLRFSPELRFEFDDSLERADRIDRLLAQGSRREAPDDVGPDGTEADSDVAPYDGIVLINKAAGVTSAGVVRDFKRLVAGKTKVGHLGTLDPFATGLLPLCVGQGTKVASYLSDNDKAYAGTILLGLETDTLDVTGQTTATQDPPDPAGLDLEALALPLRGEIEQVPPQFSALKHKGRRMYQLARQGKAPELKARPVRIDELRLSRVDERRLGFSVVCSKGTYVRSLARDLGRAIGCGATLETLSRSVFGDFRLEDAVSLAELKGPAGHEALRRATRTPAEALGFMRTLEVDSDAARELLAGRQALLAGLAEAPRGQGELARVLCRDRLVAVVVGNGGRWCLDRVFSRS